MSTMKKVETLGKRKKSIDGASSLLLQTNVHAST